jgi:putative transposase
MNIFHQREDYEVFLELLRRAVRRHPVEVHGYVLMSNHFHLLVTPRSADGLPRFMKEVDGSYVYYFNREHHRIGTLWNGRYRGIPIDNVAYLLTCIRYIEQNPVRARMVRVPDAYRWSSYAAHAFGRWPEWLTAHRVYEDLGTTPQVRQVAYRQLCSTPLPNDHLSLLR